MYRLPRPTGISATVETANVCVRSNSSRAAIHVRIDEEVVAVVVDRVLQRVLDEQRIAPAENRFVSFRLQ